MRSHLSSQPIRRPEAADPTRRRAVVLGGSLAGLLTARVLADHVDEVVVVDRDDLDCELTGPRRGVAQSRHTHGLLVRGTDAIESIVPGFTEGLLARGALRADVLAQSRWLMSDNLLSRRAPGLVGLLASRTLVESEVRRRVAPLPQVVLLGGHDIVGLRTGPGGAGVAGVVLTPRPQHRAGHQPDGNDGPGPACDLAADLVVDATGRGSSYGNSCRPTETTTSAPGRRRPLPTSSRRRGRSRPAPTGASRANWPSRWPNDSSTTTWTGC